MKNLSIVFEKTYTTIGEYLAAKIFWVAGKIFYRTQYFNTLSKRIRRPETIVFASNHATMLDPPAIFSGMSSRHIIFHLSPVKFMTASRYFNFFTTPLLRFVGCFPHKGTGLTGVDASIHYAKQGYRIFIFPEGRLNPANEATHAYEGIVRILEQLPEARLVLVNIQWEKRTKFFSRPLLCVTFSDPPDGMDQTNAMEIMRAIYASAPRIEKH